MATASKSGFVRETRDGKRVYVKRLSSGCDIVRYDAKKYKEYNVYDANGIYLGWTTNLDEAEYMAAKGFVNNPGSDHASELSLWVFWNDAVAAGCSVFLGDDGEQVIAMTDNLFMIAKKDDHGWDVEVLNHLDFEYRYGDETFSSVHQLKRIHKSQAFTLE